MTQDELAKLSVAERLTLIGELWDSIADDDVPLSQEQQEEIERRLTSFEEDRLTAKSWETIKAELARRGR